MWVLSCEKYTLLIAFLEGRLCSHTHPCLTVDLGLGVLPLLFVFYPGEKNYRMKCAHLYMIMCLFLMCFETDS